MCYRVAAHKHHFLVAIEVQYPGLERFYLFGRADRNQLKHRHRHLAETVLSKCCTPDLGLRCRPGDQNPRWRARAHYSGVPWLTCAKTRSAPACNSRCASAMPMASASVVGARDSSKNICLPSGAPTSARSQMPSSLRSEERRVGKEGRVRWALRHHTKSRAEGRAKAVERADM